MTPPGLDELLQHPSVWRAEGARDPASPRVVPTGFRQLDERLPGGGWPLDTLVEILLPVHGVGEINLLVPLLRALGQGEAGQPRRWIAWLGPPYLPYAPALAAAGLDPARMLIVRPKGTQPAGLALWAMEQALRSRACAAALGWADAAETNSLRRLKLAAGEGGSLGILFRPCRRAGEPSPAALRLRLEPRGRALDIHILKCRGGVPGTVRGVIGGSEP